MNYCGTDCCNATWCPQPGYTTATNTKNVLISAHHFHISLQSSIYHLCPVSLFESDVHPPHVETQVLKAAPLTGEQQAKHLTIYKNAARQYSLFQPSTFNLQPPHPPLCQHAPWIPGWLAWSPAQLLWRLLCRQHLDRNVCLSLHIAHFFLYSYLRANPILSFHADVSELFRYSPCAISKSSVEINC